MCRKTPDDVIKVKLSLDELELTSAESKATYEKIKEYVMRNFGLKVSTLYIAQTKQKLGIANMVIKKNNKSDDEVTEVQDG